VPAALPGPETDAAQRRSAATAQVTKTRWNKPKTESWNSKLTELGSQPPAADAVQRRLGGDDAGTNLH